MTSLASGAAQGALRGGAAAAAYASVVSSVTVVSDLVTTYVTRTTYSTGLDVATVAVFVVIALVVAMVALVVGGLGGAILGAAMVPIATHWRRPTRALAAGCGLGTFLLGLVAFPAIPLGGGGVDGIDEVVVLRVLPATFAGAAAAWHATALHRASVSGRRASTPG